MVHAGPRVPIERSRGVGLGSALAQLGPPQDQSKMRCEACSHVERRHRNAPLATRRKGCPRHPMGCESGQAMEFPRILGNFLLNLTRFGAKFRCHVSPWSLRPRICYPGRHHHPRHSPIGSHNPGSVRVRRAAGVARRAPGSQSGRRPPPPLTTPESPRRRTRRASALIFCTGRRAAARPRRRPPSRPPR